MKIGEFFSSLLPTMYKRDLVDEVYRVKEDLIKNCIPIYDDAIETFKSSELDISNSKNFKLIPSFNALVKNRPGNIIVTIDNALKVAVKICDDLKPYIEKNFQDLTVKSGMSYRKAQIIQFLTSLKFCADFSKDLLNYIIIMRTADFDSGNLIKKSLTDYQKSYIESDNFTNFCKFIDLLLSNNLNVVSILDKVPDVLIVPDNVSEMEQTVGINKVDPFTTSRFLSPKVNIFYYIGIFFADMQIKSFEKNIAERDLIKLRLINLQHQQQNTPDPAIQSQIEKLQDNLDKINYQIQKKEDKYVKSIS